MNNKKREAIVQLVEKHNGVWPEAEAAGNPWMVIYIPNFTMGLCEVFQQEFEQVARELGWINGHKYGVEYLINRGEPDLPDDVTIEIECTRGHRDLGPRLVKHNDWARTKSFRIVDERYKPKADIEFMADSMKILTPSGEYKDVINEGLNEMSNNNWYKKGELPPVGAVVEYSKHPEKLSISYIEHNWKSGDRLRVLSHEKGQFGADVIVVWNERDKFAVGLVLECLRPTQSERDKVIEVALSKIDKDLCRHKEIVECLYDKGMLKLPEDL